MTLAIDQFAYNSDNYGVLLHDGESGQTALVDAGDGDAALTALDSNGWELTQIWITHHHGDHTAGLQQLVAETNAEVFGPAGVAGVEQVMADGGSFDFAGQTVDVLATPGHTLDMLNYHLPQRSWSSQATPCLRWDAGGCSKAMPR